MIRADVAGVVTPVYGGINSEKERKVNVAYRSSPFFA